MNARQWASRRRLLGGLLVLVVAALGLSAFQSFRLARHEEQYWFRPAPAAYGDWDPPDLDFEEVRFASADGTPLVGWYVPHPQPRAVLLYCHGAGGNLAFSADDVRRLNQQLGLSVLVFDYRGFGKSGGRLDGEGGIVADARAARAWLARRGGVPESQIVLLGRSLGSGVAVDLAAADGARGLVLENAFTSMEDVTWQYYRWAFFRPPMRNRFDSLAKIGRYRGPLLQCHSQLDATVPLAMGRRLFEAACQPKKFVVIRGAGHEDAPSDEYYAALDEFIASLP